MWLFNFHCIAVILGIALSYPIHVIDYKKDVNLSTLRLVQVIFRHGDRTPIDPFPTDQYKDYWTIGYGELTNIGKQQHYALGQYIRQRYTGYLNTSYFANQLLVNSTDLDRTLNSAASNLAGLFPPTDQDQIWNQNLLWQPIPIHTRPVPIDLYLDPDSDCPAYNKESARVNQWPEMVAINEENAWLYEYLTNYTGELVDNIIQTGYVYDTIMIEKLYNLTTPSWVDPVYDQMHNLSDLGFVWRYKSPLEQRLKGGAILKEIIDNANKRINNENEIALYYYSSHDTLVSAVLSALQVFNGIAPPYASAIIFELHEYNVNEYGIQVSYYNDTRVDPYVYTIPGCSEICPIDTFTELNKNVLPQDIFKECNVTVDTLAAVYNYRSR